MSEEKDLKDILENFEAQSSEAKGFAPEQMLTCEKCKRANPPTRTICLYCGNELPATDIEHAHIPKLKKLEDWEIGYNIILLPGESKELTGSDLYSISNAFNLEVEELKKIIDAQQPLPVARAGNANEAAVVEKALSQMGLKTAVASDSEMAVGTPSQRLLGLTFTEDTLTGRTLSNEKALNVNWDDVRLFVVGRLFEKRVETEEKVSRKEVKDLEDSREFTTDQTEFDIYINGDNKGWKILSDKFDFSCLGEERGLTAAENFNKLIQSLRSRTPKALFDDSYNRVQSVLNFVWSIEQRSKSKGLKRKNFGQMYSQYVSIRSNENQFLRYSRMKAFLQ